MRPAPALHSRISGRIGGIIVLALFYYAAAQMGLVLGFANTNATPVCPPAGIALAAMVLFGPRLWPGIWLGACAANMETFSQNQAADHVASLGVSAAIATGNTLGALAGWGICRRRTGWNDDGSLP